MFDIMLNWTIETIGFHEEKVQHIITTSQHLTVQFQRLGADFGLSPFRSGKCTLIIGIPETEHVKILLTIAGKGDNQSLDVLVFT